MHLSESMRTASVAALALALLFLVGLLLQDQNGKEMMVVEPPAPERTESTSEPTVPELQAATDEAREPVRVTVTGQAPELLEESLVRDLTVRVLDASGKLLDGIPLFLTKERPKLPTEISHDDKRKTGTFNGRSPDELTGKATWLARSRPLWELWRDLDAGENVSVLTLGIKWPGTEHLWLTLDPKAWPTQPIDLQFDGVVTALLAPVRVEVYFANGEPAPNIPVGVGWTALNPEVGHALGLGDGAILSDKLALTDASGVALLSRVDFFAMGHDPSGPSDRSTGKEVENSKARFECFVGPAVATIKPVRVPVPFDADLAKPLRIDLPKGAFLTARVVDGHGRTIDPDESSIRYNVKWETASALFGQPRKGKFSGDTDQNPFELGWCGMDIQVEGSAWTPGYGNALAEGRGPIRDGEDVEFTFNAGAPYPLVRFQVLDLDGKPFANSDVEADRHFLTVAKPHQERKERNWQAYRTDTNGYFSIIWNARGPVAPMQMEVRAQLQGEMAWGNFAFPREFTEEFAPAGEAPGERKRMKGGVFQLSRTPLGPLPVWIKLIIASGTVYGELGKPLLRARVMVISSSKRDYSAWGWTNKDGHFELEAKDQGPFRLALNCDDYESLRTDEVAYGSTGLVYTMEATPVPEVPGRLHGQLLNLPRALSDYLKVRIDVDNRDLRASPNAKGEFEFKSVPPGQVDVYIECAALGIEVARFEGVTISSGQDLTDPRFEALDVGALVRLCTLRIETADGEVLPVEKIKVWLNSRHGKKLRVGGRKTRDVFIPSSYETCWFSADGFEPIEASLLGGEVLLRFFSAH